MAELHGSDGSELSKAELTCRFHFYYRFEQVKHLRWLRTDLRCSKHDRYSCGYPSNIAESTQMLPNVYELSEAAAKLKVSERFLTNGLRCGRFPGSKAGRKWVLTDDDLMAILNICAQRPKRPAALGNSMTRTTARRMASAR